MLLNIESGKFHFLFLPFFLGVIAAQKISLIGELYVGEILASAYFLVHLGRPFIAANKDIIYFLCCGAVWAVFQLISDQLNATPISKSIKGVGAPIIFVLTIAGGAAYFSRNLSRIPSFLLGAAIGGLAYSVIFANAYFLHNAWKWGVGGPLLSCISIYFSFYKKDTNFLLALSLFVFCAMSLASDSRLLALMPILSLIVYAALTRRLPRKFISILRGRYSILKVAALIILAALALNMVLTELFSSKWMLDQLPPESAAKFKMQAAGELGVLLGGRHEALASITAFLDKPLLGHGSWAADRSGYQEALGLKLYLLGYSDTVEYQLSQFDLIPSHSFLFGALVWGGIVGGLFWMFVMRWLVVRFIENITRMNYYYVLGSFNLLWNILFSPFGSSARWGSAIFIASMLCWCSLARKRHGS